MRKAPKDFPGQAFLELLRPPKLTKTHFALFAAYSADPIVLGGALLNLHARGRDNASGNKSDFAGAIEALRERVRFIVQRGRIHRGPKLPKIAAVLDQFVVEMPYRESANSWHPKAALICYQAEGPQRFWRLWVGSRNLTMSRDLDLGLVLDGESRRRKGSQVIGGIDALGATLARAAKLPDINPDDLAKELGTVRWIAPDGINVSRIDLWTRGSEPVAPLDAASRDKIVVLSPFLCDAFARSLADMTKASADRTLVTTLPALRKLGKDGRMGLSDFKLLALGAPIPEGDDVDEDARKADREPATDEEDDDSGGASHSGLHAKLFAAIQGEQIEIVAGSANATDRAWSGRNAEVAARFTGGGAEIDGVLAIVGSATPVSDALLQTLTETEADTAELPLERLRWTLADTSFSLDRNGKMFRLTSGEALSLPPSAQLDVGLATMALHRWQPGVTHIELGEVPLSLQTDLVQFRLTLGDMPPASWLLRVSVFPLIDAERDAAAISRFLSVAGLQAWLREMLEGGAGAGSEDDWDMEPEGFAPKRSSWKHDGLALEDILTAWAKDQTNKSSSLKRVDAVIDRYVAAVLAHGEQLTQADRDDLTALQQTWRIAREVLIAK
ncbi:phospholipase D family protein [Sphingomonas lacusdianchii]|uniref:phospholipase D family protein n=1 Tax=Sphingomonas lacusdianchii TaxID=2917992 RepID=UPI001F57EBE8|nr:phospholipase D family protein [Sphingomonas sp. JXJ CY 53]